MGLLEPISRRRRPLSKISLLLAALVFAGCQSGGGILPMSKSSKRVKAPSEVKAQVGKGRHKVYGSNLYSTGQKLYKELRQQESLMAFLACQGEPDQAEVVHHPGAPKIILYYSRGGLPERGEVAITPSVEGYYVAQPIQPRSRRSSPSPPPPQPKSPAPTPPVPEVEPPEPEPEPEPGPEELPEAPAEDEGEPEFDAPQPSPEQLDDCPIEPWRLDCQDLCVDEAAWEWCGYEG